jgi:DNA-binding transcriptional LysR family regulator
MVFVADPANPRLRASGDGMWRLTAADLAVLPHAAIRLPDPASDAMASALLRHGVRANVVITTAGWLPLPFLVAGSDMVAAIPARLARRFSGAAGITIVEPPFGVIEMTEAAWWHPLHATDLGLTWLRGLVTEVAAELTPAPPLPEPRPPGDRG